MEAVGAIVMLGGLEEPVQRNFRMSHQTRALSIQTESTAVASGNRVTRSSTLTYRIRYMPPSLSFNVPVEPQERS